MEGETACITNDIMTCVQSVSKFPLLSCSCDIFMISKIEIMRLVTFVPQNGVPETKNIEEILHVIN